MIQRIQSVWLFLAAISFLAQWLPEMVMVRTMTPGPGIYSDKVLYVGESIALMLGSGISGLLAFIAIFLFKERTFQIMTTALASLTQLILCVGTVFFGLYKTKKLNAFDPDMGLFLAMAGMVFIWLATRAIKKDQELVKSMDRLR
jgi:hypothetical protein